MIKLCLICLLFVSSMESFAVTTTKNSANDLSTREALTITGVKIREVKTPESLVAPLVSTNPLGDVILAIDSLLALGQKAWTIIENGRPTVTTKLAPAVSIIPNIDGTNVTLTQMENWSVPRMVSYRISFTNALGMEIIGFTYTVFFQHSGTYNGKGKYVTNLKVQASDISASWGSDFDASSELVGISNVGTLQDPIASGIIQISYNAKGIFNQNSGAHSFYVDGAGHISQIND